MFHQTIRVPSAGGYEVPVDAYVPSASASIAPEIRRPAIVLFPGGGYTHLGSREAEPVALRFLSLGFNVFTVTYRFAPWRYPVPMQDGAAVIAYVRANAAQLHTDPERIAVLGFSAGGHLAGTLGVSWQRKELWADMDLTPEDVRPNAMVLGYAVLTAGENAHRSSFENLTGSADPAGHQAYGVETQVTEDCPPTFLFAGYDDAAVPVQNTLLMALALSRRQIPAEVHIFRHGPHGAALFSEITSGPNCPQMNVPEAARWPEMAAAFLNKAMPARKNEES